jgi:hypothetical protein
MRKFNFLFLLLALFIFAGTANSQITVTGSNGLNATYPSFTQAGGMFAAFNAGGSQAGMNITVAVTADVATEDGANSLNAGLWTSMTISPSGGAARTISGSTTGPLFAMDGPDNVTIDGLNSGGNSLTISNTSTGSSSTIRFTTECVNNTITNCTISGSNTSVSSGTIFFGPGAGTGINGITVSNCNIGPAGSNLPINGIYSAGTSAIIPNTVIVNNNNIFDYFNAGSISTGVLVNTNNTGWRITNNRFYQTGTRTYTTGTNHGSISIFSGTNYVVTGNTIGYATSGGTGTYTMAGTVATRYVGILGTFSTTGNNRIAQNIFRNFSLTTSSGTGTTNGIWCAVSVTAGVVAIDSNSVGETTNNGSILTTSTTTGALTVGIHSSSTTGNVSIQGNTISSMSTTSATATIGSVVTGIGVSTGGATFSLVVANNLIGSNTQANSLQPGNTNATPSGTMLTNGIVVAAGYTGVVRISNNTVRNLTTGLSSNRSTGANSFIGISNASIGSALNSVSIDSNTVQSMTANGTFTTANTTGSTGIVNSSAVPSGQLNIRRNTVRDITTSSASTSFSTSALLGISITGAAVAYNCSDNTVFNLSCAHSTAANVVSCIYTSATGAGNSVITRNLIYNTTIASSSITAQHTGIFIFNASTLGYTISNNMISLGSAVTANQVIYGIDEESIAGAVYNIWFNSIYIGGAATSNTARTACLIRETSTATWSIESNIFQNSRTFTGLGNLGYGMIFNVNTALAPNYNNIYTPGANGCTARNTGLAADYSTLTAWRTANPTFDAVSFSADPLFVSPSTATPDLHLQDPNPQSRAGGTNASVTVDFDGNTRPATAGQRPDMGADESNFGVHPDNMDYQGPALHLTAACL